MTSDEILELSARLTEQKNLPMLPEVHSVVLAKWFPVEAHRILHLLEERECPRLAAILGPAGAGRPLKGKPVASSDEDDRFRHDHETDILREEALSDDVLPEDL
jgi:hypothetical protein